MCCMQCSTSVLHANKVSRASGERPILFAAALSADSCSPYLNNSNDQYIRRREAALKGVVPMNKQQLRRRCGSPFWFERKPPCQVETRAFGAELHT